MKGSVDSRVVEMHFDNSDFMEKIKETIDALEKLNEQISAINASNGLNNLTGKMGGNDLGNVANSVGNIERRFSTLGIVGMTVIQRLTNAGIDMVNKLGNGFRTVINQVESGGKQRALNLEQAKFRLEGVLGDVEKVNAVMDDVDRAVQGTAYGLDEAAVSASMFAATGIKAGDEMFRALRSTAGIAATFGTDFQTVSNIMVDAAAAGHLTNDALTRLTMQGVPAMQILQKEYGKTTEEIQKMATDGKISFAEFAKLMDEAYGKHAQDANKMFQGALANTKTALSRLGAKFYEPAFKFGIDIFNEFREDINSFSSGVDDAAKSFSVFGKYFTESFVGSLKSLRESGTFENIGKGISNIASALFGWRGILRTIKDAFIEVFPAVTIKNIAGLSDIFYDLTHKFKELGNNTVFLEKLKNVMTGIFYIFKAFINIVSGVVKVFSAFIKAVVGITNKTVDLSEGFANIGKAMSKISGATDVFDFLASVIEGAGNVISKVFDTIFNSIKKLISGFSDTIGGINDLNGAMSLMAMLWAGLFGGQLFGKLSFKLKTFTQIFTGVSDVIATFKRTAKSLPSSISGTLTALTNALNNMTAEVQSKALKNIALGVLALAVALKILSEIDNKGLAKGLGAVTTLMAEMVGVMAILTKLVTSGEFANSVKGIYALGSVTNSLMKIGVAMILMATALKMISTLEPKQLATGLIGITVMLGAVLGFVIVLDKYQKMVADPKVGLMMIGIALALSTMAKAVQMLSSLKPSELAKGLGSVIIIMGAIFGFMAAMDKMKVSSGGGMIAAGIGMIAIAAAINILAPALQRLGSLSLEQLAKGLLAISIAMMSMAAVSQYMSTGGAVGMLVMSVALSSLAGTIERVGSLDISTIAKGLGTIIVSIAALGAAAVILGPASAALLALGAAMLLVSASFAVFGAGLVLIGLGLTSISSGILSFAAVTTTSLNLFINTIKIILKELIAFIPSVAAAIAEGFVVFLEQIAALAPRFTEAATTIIHSLLKAFEDNVPDIISTGLRMLLAFLSGLEEAIPRISSSCAAIISGFIDGVAEQMDSIIQSGFNLMISFINGLAEGIRDNKEAFRSAIQNLCTAGLEAFMAFFGISSPSTVMQSMGTYLVEGLVNGIKSFSGIGDILISSVSTGVNAIGKYVSKYTAKGKDLAKGIAAGVKDKAGDVKEKVGDAVGKAKDKVAGVVSKFSSAGKDLAKGIAAGIKNGVSSVISAAGSIADSALKKFKSKLGIKSPSKVFAEESRWIPEGVALGIKKTAYKVEDAVGRMADASIKPLGEAIAKANSELVLNDDFNPTITPVLDLSEVRKNAGEIDYILGNHTLSMAYSANQAYEQSNQALQFNMMNKLLNKLDEISKNNNNTSNMVNNISVEGSTNPEDFANQLLNSFKMRMRTV